MPHPAADAMVGTVTPVRGQTLASVAHTEHSPFVDPDRSAACALAEATARQSVARPWLTLARTVRSRCTERTLSARLMSLFPHGRWFVLSNKDDDPAALFEFITLVAAADACASIIALQRRAGR